MRAILEVDDWEFALPWNRHVLDREIPSIITAHDYDFHPKQKFPRSITAGSSVLNPICDDVEHWCAVGDAAMGLITAVNAKRISMALEGDESDEICSIPDYYAVLAQTYEKEKKQDYRLARFDGVFWSKRQVYIYIRFIPHGIPSGSFDFLVGCIVLDWIQLFSVCRYLSFSPNTVHYWFLMLYNGSPLNV